MISTPSKSDVLMKNRRGVGLKISLSNFRYSSSFKIPSNFFFFLSMDYAGICSDKTNRISMKPENLKGIPQIHQKITIKFNSGTVTLLPASIRLKLLIVAGVHLR